MFPWKGKRVAIRSIPPAPKPIKEEELKFIFICNRCDSLVGSKKIKQGFALLVKKIATPLQKFMRR